MSELHDRRQRADLDDEAREAKRLRKAEKALETRLLEPWERYRALNDLLDMYLDMIELADRKARFSLVVLGALNAVNLVFVARPDLLGPAMRADGRLVGAYAGIYITVSVFLLTQAIGALRPRVTTFLGRSANAARAGEGLPGLRFIGDVAGGSPSEYYERWINAEVGGLNREVSLHVQTLAGINAQKYRALDRVFHGLTALAILTIALIAFIVFRGIAA